jgi:hypothetical protein
MRSRNIPKALVFVLLVFYNGSFAKAQNINEIFGKSNNNSLGISDNNRSPINRSLPARDLKNITQEFLDSVREISSEEEQGFYKLKLPFSQFALNPTNPQRIYVKRGNLQYGRLEGRLIAVSEDGLYLYNSVNQIFRFVHFENIKYIRRGLPFEKKIVRDALLGGAAGAVIGGLAGLSDPEHFFVFIFGGAFIGGITLPPLALVPEAIVHLIQGEDPQIKSNINFNKVQMGYYLQMVSQDWMRYGARILYSDFPRVNGTVMDSVPVLAQTDVRIPSDTVAVNLKEALTVIPEPARDGAGMVPAAAPVSPEKEKASVQVAVQPAATVVPLSAFKEGNFIAAAWMYKGFNSKSVDVKRMLRIFPNLRFNRLSETDAPAFKNKDEVRYAAMTICTQIGYDFTKVVVFSESQELDLSQALPFYNVETVASNTEIKSKALTEIDEFNLQFLYDLLKSTP